MYFFLQRARTESDGQVESARTERKGHNHSDISKDCPRAAWSRAGSWWWFPKGNGKVGTEHWLSGDDSTVCLSFGLINANSWSWLHAVCGKFVFSESKGQMPLPTDNVGESAIWRGDMCSHYSPRSAGEGGTGTDVWGPKTFGGIVSTT